MHNAIQGPTRYASLKDKIRAEKAERLARYAGFAALYKQAHEAGMAAGNAAVPVPMVVTSGDGALTPGLERKHWIVPEGVCGFASVVVHPATCSFARWYAKTHNERKAYGGGICVKWVGEFNQSMTRKEAYAHAFAEVLRAAGIKAYSQSRMD